MTWGDGRVWHIKNYLSRVVKRQKNLDEDTKKDVSFCSVKNS